MFPRADLALYNRDGQLIAVVEVKNKLGTSALWAAQLRRNILAHGGFQNVPYFLLMTPDRIYLWKDAGTDPVPTSPTYEKAAQGIFSPYFDKSAIEPSEVSSAAFELIVTAWLGNLVRTADKPEDLTSEVAWLVESGLLGAIQDGRLEYEVAA